MDITANIEVIGVKEAADYLQFNINNRPIKQSHVEHLVDEMLSGRWKFNGESIVFDNQGVLRNGQHRLTAILKARWREAFLVVRGIDPSAFSTMDCGRARSGQDALSLLGHQNAKVKANVIVWLEQYYNNTLRAQSTQWGSKTKTSPSKVVELSSKYKNLYICDNGRSLGVQTITNVCKYIFSTLDHEMASDFLQKVETGENLTANDQEYLLRNRLIANRTSRARLSNKYILALFIKAWNNKRGGRVVKCLKVQEGEEFPTAI
jgi:hypothetical protein